MESKFIISKTLQNGGTCAMLVENLVLAIAYFTMASYYLLLAINILIG